MNIFKKLKKGNHREEEFFSSSLCILLSEIPELTSFLIQKLLNKKIGENFEVNLEESFSNGRIDIAVKSLNLDVYIENKITADLGKLQLKRYSDSLKKKPNETNLILLTRYYIEDESIKYVDKHVFWTELYSLIELFKNSKIDYVKIKDNKRIYLIEQFLDFLKEENMSDEKVSWEYSEGVNSFLNLLNMIRSVLDELKKEKVINNYGKITIGEEWAGVYINKRNHKDDFWCGIYYDSVDELCFEIQSGLTDKLGDKFKDLVRNPSDNPSYFYDFNEKYFLAFSKEEQKKAIRNFVKDCIKDINKLIK